ncbi:MULTISPECIES: hypothetical protein [Mycobacteroides]|uniref:Phage gp6-like head-tail connector protein n=1 Tax=Mycobacteroides franklinii TaxID=948102 RepID=A0A4V6PJZ2_9MYCO|nr:MULTISPECIES: hypothetical protein [Mycobacteroides]KRQ20059.1 hypothetical protein AOT91_27460 [Mycobacteroides sp. H092]KRQ41843.1 hypothetical protein AOT92_10330 [Mycobacteroides sp. H101]KRQ50299.1 hypothetical protein AOT88_09230 [Mycobacteroides sp. H063]KRQ56529.1 hypothetical protein AOT94_20970 [Mycobacteroides sp. HXVII]KRQ59175.1 hypothetical protein AOT90_23300 [Mycobacteroides sp. H079]
MLAADADVEARLGRDLTTDEQDRVDDLLEEASDLVIGFLRCTPDPVPGAVVRVTARMVARVFGLKYGPGESPDPTVESVNAVMGPFQVNRKIDTDRTDGEPWLSKKDRLKLRPYRCSGLAGNVPTSKW